MALDVDQLIEAHEAVLKHMQRAFGGDPDRLNFADLKGLSASDITINLAHCAALWNGVYDLMNRLTAIEVYLNKLATNAVVTDEELAVIHYLRILINPHTDSVQVLTHARDM